MWPFNGKKERTEVRTAAGLILAALVTACAATTPQAPAKEGVLVGHPIEAVYEAALSASKSLGFSETNTNRPHYIGAMTPLKQMGTRPAGEGNVWVLQGRKMLGIWLESVGANSTRMVVEPYVMATEEDEKNLIANIRAILK